jgi:hypothetical protein
MFLYQLDTYLDRCAQNRYRMSQRFSIAPTRIRRGPVQELVSQRVP